MRRTPGVLSFALVVYDLHRRVPTTVRGPAPCSSTGTGRPARKAASDLPAVFAPFVFRDTGRRSGREGRSKAMQSNPKRDERGRSMGSLVPALRALSSDDVKRRDPSRRPIEAIEIERQLFRATDLAEAPVEASFGDRSIFIHSERPVCVGDVNSTRRMRRYLPSRTCSSLSPPRRPTSTPL